MNRADTMARGATSRSTWHNCAPREQVFRGEHMSESDNVIVVGAGLAASTFAFQLRRRGYTGRVALLGEESVHPYDRPPLSKELLWSANEFQPRLLRDVDDYAEQDIEVRTEARVVGLDVTRRTVQLHSGDHIPFSRLVIATGSRPRVVPGIATELAGVHMLRNFDDCLNMRAEVAKASHLVIVGGGLIGAEVAAGAAGHRIDVTLVDPLPVLLARSLGGVTSEHVTRMHRDGGVDLELGVGVKALRRSGDRLAGVELSDGRVLEADVVLLALGSAPDVAWLAGSGIDVRRGIVTDSHHRTSVPGIYAIGDVAETHDPVSDRHAVIEHWMNARDQAVALADAFTDADGGGHVHLPYFWSEQFGTRIQSLGHPDPTSAHHLLKWNDPKPGALYLFGAPDRITGAVGFNAAARLMRLRPQIIAGATWAEAEATVFGGIRATASS
ncbi:oxidoreductase [Rhodococcus opacus]|nr:oxidoreductase [Rhodococcus opacus]